MVFYVCLGHGWTEARVLRDNLASENESPVTFEHSMRRGQIKKSTALETLHGNLLVCHTEMMDCHCFRVLLYVCFGHPLARELHDNLALERVLSGALNVPVTVKIGLNMKTWPMRKLHISHITPMV